MFGLSGNEKSLPGYTQQLPKNSSVIWMRPHKARSVADLVTAIAEHGNPQWIHFWGHRPEKDGSIGKGCFSQWWPCEFTVDKDLYRSAEHSMMAEKARLFR